MYKYIFAHLEQKIQSYEIYKLKFMMDNCLNTLLKLTIPFKSLSYYEEFFDQVKVVALNGPTINIKLFVIILIIKLVNILAIILTPIEHEREQILLLNYNIIFDRPPNIKLLTINILYQCNYYYYLMYFKTYKNAFCTLAQRILFDNVEDKKIFLYSTWNNVNLQWNIRRVAYFLLNVFQSFVFVGGSYPADIC